MDDLPSLYEGLTHLLSSLFFQIIEAEVSFKMASMLSYQLLVMMDVFRWLPCSATASRLVVQQIHTMRLHHVPVNSTLLRGIAEWKMITQQD